MLQYGNASAAVCRRAGDRCPAAALLSTHTGGFHDFTFLDLTAEMDKILSHFCSLGVQFEYLCTGYFGSAR